MQVEDKATLVSRSDQKKLDTPEQVKETLIRLAADELMSPNLPENVSQFYCKAGYNFICDIIIKGAESKGKQIDNSEALLRQCE